MLSILKEKLIRTRDSFRETFEEIVLSKKNKDEILEGLMETLILADAGLATSEKIVESLRQKTKKTSSPTEVKQILQEELIEFLSRFQNKSSPQEKGIVMMVGINGGGKTTSLAKLANLYQARGKEIIMVAADTFRAAAQEQLSIWGKRLNVPVIKGQYGADPASVVYDAAQSFKSRKSDFLMIDTAGRIHTNINLMNELEKINRVISRELKEIPKEILLVLDASIGQNALIQAREFHKFSALTGIFLTKLDGTAKGGCVLSIIDELELPIKYIGIGESLNDVLPFSPEEFVQALLS